MEDLQTKVAIITGGTRGIGYGIAQGLLAEGVQVAITGRNKVMAEKAAAALNKNVNTLGRAIGLQADVRNFESQQIAVNDVIKEFGTLDIVIANAGLGYFNPITKLSIQEWQDTIDTNLTGVFFTIKATVDQLIKNKGYFISISSLAGTNFFAGGAAYNASKFGLTGFSQAIMLDLRKYDVKVSTIMPGSVATEFNVSRDDDSWKIQKEDIGTIVVSLLKMHPRTLPSKIEVRPTKPPGS